MKATSNKDLKQMVTISLIIWFCFFALIVLTVRGGIDKPIDNTIVIDTLFTDSDLNFQ